MTDSNIYFHVEDVDFKLKNQDYISEQILDFIKSNHNSCSTVNYIFCSDKYLLDLNKQYLDHDYYTDILSFQLDNEPIQGDIFISVERVEDNAKSLNIHFDDEMLRVISHGILHFLGYKDKTEEEITEMRKQENKLIKLLKK